MLTKGKHSSLSCRLCLIFESETYPRVENLKGTPLRWVTALLSNIRPGYKCLPGASTLAYFADCVLYLKVRPGAYP
jgi:hypothetical protein